MSSPLIIESDTARYWRMCAAILAHILGLPNSDGILPILALDGSIKGWYVRSRGVLKAGEVW